MSIFSFDDILKKKYKLLNKNIFNLTQNEFKDKFLQKILLLSQLYFTGISENYIKRLIENNKVKILFITMGQKFNLNEIVSIIFYHKTLSKEINKYYILCFGTHRKFRKFGYGKYSLDKFIEWIKLIDNSNKEKIILLKSLETSLSFYKIYGFIQSDLVQNKLFFKYEPYDELKLNQDKILKFIVS